MSQLGIRTKSKNGVRRNGAASRVVAVFENFGNFRYTGRAHLSTGDVKLVIGSPTMSRGTRNTPSMSDNCTCSRSILR